MVYSKIDPLLQKVTFILGLQHLGGTWIFKFSNVDLIRMRTEAAPCKKRRAGVGWQSQRLRKISLMCCVRELPNTASFPIPTLIFLYLSPPDCKDHLT